MSFIYEPRKKNVLKWKKSMDVKMNWVHFFRRRVIVTGQFNVQ